MALISPDEDSAKVTFPPPLVFLGFVLIGFVIDRAMGLNPAIARSLRIGLGGGAILCGLALVVSGLLAFRRAGNDPEPWKTSNTIVAAGIYRFTRNPMYLGLAVASFGIAIAGNSLGALLTLPLSIITIRTQVIAREEAYLTAKFGQPYKDYCACVRRWI